MKILQYGHKGWIGNLIKEELNKRNIESVNGNIRCYNVKDLDNEIRKVKPSHIICSIGRTHSKDIPTIDYLEDISKIDINVRDNLFSPIVLAMLCKKYDIHLTYIGTGCIFEYSDGLNVPGGFREENIPNFKGSAYSIVKGYTDELMHLFEDTVLNLRIRMPISSDLTQSRNFIKKIITYNKICSIDNSMTVLDDLIPILVDMCKDKETGTYNFTNPGVINHNEILEMYKELIDNNFTWENMTIDEQNKMLKSKRSNNKLDTTKLKKYNTNILNIKDSIQHIFIKNKNLDKDKERQTVSGIEWSEEWSVT